MALTGLLILASGFFLVSLAVLPGVNHRIRGVTSAGVYYGWWVLAACCLLALFTGGIFYRGFTVFFLPIQREFNLSRASTSLIFSLATAEGGIGGPFVGWLIDRLGSRPLILVGGLLAGLGFMVLSFVNGYFSFLIVYVGIVSVGISTCLDPQLDDGSQPLVLAPEGNCTGNHADFLYVGRGAPHTPVSLRSTTRRLA